MDGDTDVKRVRFVKSVNSGVLKECDARVIDDGINPLIARGGILCSVLQSSKSVCYSIQSCGDYGN